MIDQVRAYFVRRRLAPRRPLVRQHGELHTGSTEAPAVGMGTPKPRDGAHVFMLVTGLIPDAGSGYVGSLEDHVQARSRSSGGRGEGVLIGRQSNGMPGSRRGVPSVSTVEINNDK